MAPKMGGGAGGETEMPKWSKILYISINMTITAPICLATFNLSNQPP